MSWTKARPGWQGLAGVRGIKIGNRPRVRMNPFGLFLRKQFIDEHPEMIQPDAISGLQAAGHMRVVQPQDGIDPGIAHDVSQPYGHVTCQRPGAQRRRQGGDLPDRGTHVLCARQRIRDELQVVPAAADVIALQFPVRPLQQDDAAMQSGAAGGRRHVDARNLDFQAKFRFERRAEFGGRGVPRRT